MKSIVLFRFCDAQTPLARLLARRRWSMWIITAWLASTVTMVEAWASILWLGPSIVAMATMLIAVAVNLVTSIPAIFLMPAVREMERELAARGVFVSVENRLDRYGRRVLVFALLVAIALATFR